MAQIGQTGLRKDPSDRNKSNPGEIHIVNSAVGPHAETVRISYTVPSNRKARIAFAQCIISRVTAAAPVGLAESFVAIAPNGLGNRHAAEAFLATNGVGDRDRLDFHGDEVLNSADKWQHETVDTSTGGTVTYISTSLIDEYDA